MAKPVKLNKIVCVLQNMLSGSKEEGNGKEGGKCEKIPEIFLFFAGLEKA